MQRSITEKLSDSNKPKRRRSAKAKSYSDEINLARAKVGDAIYLPRQPDHVVTVTSLPNSMSYGPRKIGISWFDQNGKLRQDEVDPAGFLKG